ncbi:TPA: LOW QUALITY PROTEIN: hypothetical protein N0F65_011867 [Lagenidium giganteum]|uniref:Protein cereblon n=1 Tax=Lagenidium giganteum TaxID=4803 RepID=A0AAV2YPG7_9STRA|nr:TPA: LOW QUALITY PROTEIN: hypothetical protein N0F65_011867 [Lagenidium giganteum]
MMDPHVHDTMTVDERPVDGRGSTRPSGDGAHAYLGELQDVEHVHRSLLPAGRVVTLPLVYLRDTVLFPGDELPLKMFPGQSVAAVRSRIAGEGGLLAVVCVDQSLEFFGTTVRVEHFHVGEDDQTAVTGVAKQRFRLKAVRHTDLETLKGDVEILPDYAPLPLPFPVPRTTWKRPNVLPGAPSLPTRRRPLRLPRTPGHWDYRTYRLFDGAALVEQIQQTMLASADWNWFRQMTTDEGSAATLVRSLTLPSSQQDPTTFSFWLAGNIPMDQRQRLELLQINCTVRRLQRLLQLLQAMEEHIYCARCETPLAKTRDIFSMTNQGATGTFLNPGGCVHQTLTLRAIQESNTDNGHEHSTEASWFPGYAWSILHCARCMNHLGWRFDRIRGCLSTISSAFVAQH